MANLFKIALALVAIWVAAEVYGSGVDGAFGGLFASRPDTSRLDAPANREAPDRPAADAFQRAYNKSEGRVEEQLERGEYAETKRRRR